MFLLYFIFEVLWLILKFIYYIMKYTIKFIIFLLKNPILRFPTIIVSIGILLSIKPLIIASIYFLYLVHYCAIRFNIYYILKNNLYIYIGKIINSNKIKTSIRSLCCDYSLLNNTVLEGIDKDFQLYHLVITDRGIYNIIPLSNLESSFNNSLFNNLDDYSFQISQLKELIYSILPKTLPVSTIFIICTNEIPPTLSSNLGEVISTDSLAEYIDNCPYKKHYFKPKDIKKQLLENKLWFIDILFINLFKFIKFNKNIIIFLFLCPIVYCIYIFLMICFAYIIIKLYGYFINYLFYL